MFPLSDRSGVNLKGDFNFENKTEFIKQVFDESMMELDGHASLETISAYNSFWELQEYFSNPVPVAMDPLRFQDMQKVL